MIVEPQEDSNRVVSLRLSASVVGLALALALSACGATAAGTVSIGDPASTLPNMVPYDGGAESQFVPWSPAPSRPPTVVLEGDGGLVVGVLYTADWAPPGVPAVVVRPRVPVPWPEPVTLRGQVGVRFDGGRPPDEIFARAYPPPQTPTGEPDAAPLTTFECRSTAEPRCEVAGNGTIRLRGLPTGGHLVIFASWVAGGSDQDSLPASVSASWLFRFQTS